MGFLDRLRPASPLQAAIKRGLAPGGNLTKELNDLDEEEGIGEIRSRADALAICDALAKLADGCISPPRHLSSALHRLTVCFQEVAEPGCPAADVFLVQGIPLLARITRQFLEGENAHEEDDVLFILKILAAYGTVEGADLVVQAARKPAQPEGYMWAVILGNFTAQHPELERLFAGLTDPLPPGFIAVALLDTANQHRLAGGTLPHPFDSDEGVSRLAAWLRDASTAEESKAVSAVTALPFLEHPERNSLLEEALAHPRPAVALEAASAAARLGRESGVKTLARLCLDLNQSARARHCLEELDREDAVPGEALAPDFTARAGFAAWLAHPNELGIAPDSVEVFDRRELAWPPDFEPKILWLLRYRAPAVSELDDIQEGVGLFGSVTFCLFGLQLEQRPAGDGYAIHCAWELENASLLELTEVPPGSNDYDSLLDQWTGAALTGCEMRCVAELGPELRRPRRLVGIASAMNQGVAGWAVLDGPESAWYPAADFRATEASRTILEIDIGRKLLGLGPETARREHLRPALPRPPERTVAGYERMLHRFAADIARRPEDLKDQYSQLGQHLLEYARARHQLRGGPHAEHMAAAYEQVLILAREAESQLGGDAFDTFSPVGESRFEAYVDALVTLGRQSEIPALISLLAPHWDHNLGHGFLGTAAFKAGDYDLAESFFLKLQEGLEGWQRCEEMDLLAEIWARRGRMEDARGLLLECLRAVLKESRLAPAADRPSHEESFQAHLEAYIRIFPDAIASLASAGIPASTLGS